MTDYRIQSGEEMVGSGHPSKSDTLNRLALVGHNTDGTHKAWADILEYGAVGDGSTDDTTAIQAAINTGEKVYVPGTSAYYKITSALTVLSNTELVGDGVRSQIRQVTSNTNIITGTSVNDVVIEGLYLYGPGDASADADGNGIYLSDCNRIKVFNNKFTNIGNTGVHLKNSNYCHVLDNIMVSFAHDVQDAADIAVKYSSSYNTIRGNKCISGTGTGILIQAVTAGDYASWNDVIGNLVTAHDRYGIVLYSASATAYVYGCRVIGNIVKDISDVTATTFGAGIYALYTSRTTISGNHVENTNTGTTADTLTPAGIGVNDSVDVSVVGNTVKGCQWYGIKVKDPSAYGGGVNVISNNVTDCVKSGIYGIAVLHLNISGNTVKGCNQGIYVKNSGTGGDAHITGNFCISNTNNGILNDGFYNSLIKDNTCKSNTTHGIAVTNAQRVKIDSNNCRSNTTRGIDINTGNSYIEVVNNDCSANSYGIVRNTGSASIRFEGNSSYSNTTADWSNGPLVDLPVNDATPTVAGNSLVRTANTNPTTITMFDDGTSGQEITVIFNDANTTIDFTGTNLKGNVGVDFTGAVGDIMTGVFDGTDWYFQVHDNTP